MSWFKRESPIRTSFRGKIPPMFSKEPDASTCYEAFKTHWQQAWSAMIGSQVPETTSRTQISDQVIRTVVNNLENMVALLLHDLQRGPQLQDGETDFLGQSVHCMHVSSILTYMLAEDVLDKLFSWSSKTGEFVSVMKIEQLKLYETLISHSRQILLVHRPILLPLLKLLAACGECSPVEVEKRLVILLNQLCVTLTQSPPLLELFFSPTSQDSTRFLVFSLLTPFLHREGGIGQQARDALLLCLSMSKHNQQLGIYIAEQSTFCPVLATGLSGLYSLLPRKLVLDGDEWHCLVPEDVQEVPELGNFLNSLEFCNAAVQVSHKMVQEQLLDYIYQGFLLPVLGPSLHQTAVDGIIAATAYLDLFLKTVTEPILMQAFLKFIFHEQFEGSPIILTLIQRITWQHKLGQVTLSLFNSLVSMNCEDVMIELVFKYLIPCTHVMVSQRSRVREFDVYAMTASKFLTLIPECCRYTPSTDDLTISNSAPTTAATQSIIASHGSSPKSSLLGSLRRKNSAFGAAASSLRNESEYLHNAGSTPAALGGSSVEVLQTSYVDYLNEARKGINVCVQACSHWRYIYNGIEPAGDLLDSQIGNRTVINEHNQSGKEEMEIRDLDYERNTLNSEQKDYRDVIHSAIVHCDTEPDTDSNKLNEYGDDDTGEPSNKNTRNDDDMDGQLNGGSDHVVKVEQTIRSRSSSLDDKRKISTSQQVVGNGYKNRTDPCIVTIQRLTSVEIRTPDIGPFLNALLTKLEGMLHHGLYVNLLFTGIISRLALYPQPLLRSFLLNHSLVFQPSIRSLIQVLGSLKHKIDSYASTIENFSELTVKARRFLLNKDDNFVCEQGLCHSAPARGSLSIDASLRGNKKRSFSDILFRRPTLERPSLSSSSFLRNAHDSNPRRFVARSGADTEWIRTKQTVLCAVVLEEFLKELAAITQEHTVTCQEAKLDIDWIFQSPKQL